MAGTSHIGIEGTAGCSFLTGGGKNLEKVFDRVRSKIGRRRRAIIYAGWLVIFQKGISAADHPINWNGAGTAERAVKEGSRDGN